MPISTMWVAFDGFSHFFRMKCRLLSTLMTCLYGKKAVEQENSDLNLIQEANLQSF